MGICLGNLKTKEILNRLGIELSKEDFKTLDSMREDNADVSRGRWHGFDLPFQITCGDVETAQIVTNILSPFADEFKAQIQIVHK
jgi:hypothetical protein